MYVYYTKSMPEGMPKTIEREREKYIVKKLKELLESGLCENFMDKYETGEIDVLDCNSVEEIVEKVKKVASELTDEVTLWYEIGGLTNMIQIKDFFRKKGIDIDLEKTIADIGEEFDGAWKNVNSQKQK